MKDAPVKPFRVRIDLNKNPVLLNYMKNSHIRDAAPKSLESLWRNRLARQTVNLKVGGSSPPRDGYFCLPLPVQKRQLAWWRNGSASDSRSEGCVFKSRPGHRLFSFFFRFFSPPPLYLIKETIMHQNSARSEDRTHDLQIALIILIMRLTRYLLRYPGTYAPRSGKTIYIPLTVIDHLS